MALEGFSSLQTSLHRQIRNAAAVMYHAMGGKDRIEKYWPLNGDKPVEDVKFVWGDTEEEAKARMNEILKYHNVKLPEK